MFNELQNTNYPSISIAKFVMEEEILINNHQQGMVQEVVSEKLPIIVEDSRNTKPCGHAMVED
jgi:hypothetical protein